MENSDDRNHGDNKMEANPEVPSQMRPLLHTASLLGDQENVQRLISTGLVDLNELDFAGCTCVQLAAAAGYLNVVKMLVAGGASIGNKDTSHGNTALHEASWRGYSSLVKFLANTETVNVQNKGGFTPLHLACQAGHNQSTRELLLAEGKPNIANTYGDSALHTAVRYGHAGVTRILLSARALTDARNKNGDTALHISSAMGRKKLTKILLSAGCLPNVQNKQNESPLDISLRKGFEDVSQVLRNPPRVVTPMERDQMRSSKYKSTSSTSALQTAPAVAGSSKFHHGSHPVLVSSSHTVEVENHRQYSKRSNPSSTKTGSQSKSMSSINRGTGTGSGAGTKTTVSSRTAVTEVPKWSPYGCHNQPNPGAFPPPNIDSLPSDPLTTGELYYLDLAGNIKKGPMGVSEGCYCGPLLSQSRNSQSLIALDGMENSSVATKNRRNHKSKIKQHQNTLAEMMEPDPPHPHSRPAAQDSPKYEDQLKSLTHQLSKIHFDTQAQLSSLHSMLNERLKERTTEEIQASYDENETKLKEWVRHYRRFRKELAKNPKTLQHANELLASASSLLSTRLASPPPQDSETDSGL